MFEVYARLPETMELDAVPDYARRVEAMGFDGLMVAETVHDGFLLACQALAVTRRIRVTVSALIAFPRSPMIVALAAWDLQRMSGGRFEPCLGTQIRQNIEDRYSARWLPPAKGMREYVAALRAIFHSFRTREPLHFVGEYYRFTRLQPFFNPGPMDAPDVPLGVGAIGPLMLAMAGEVADQFHTHPSHTTPRYLREVILPAIASGAQKRVPQLAKPFIHANIMVATGADRATLGKERERSRELLAFLFSTPAYWRSLELYGWKPVGEQLRQMTRDKRWQEMTGVMSDAMLDEFVVTALYSDLADCLRQRFDGLVDRVAMDVYTEDPACDAHLAAVVQALRTP